MFYFVVETMDLYYKRKLLNIANNRLDSYIALRFRGLDAKKVQKEDITKEMQLGWHTVQSQSEMNQCYQVNMQIGVCTCTKGQDGSPCIHQAAVLVHFGDESVNYIATLSASRRHNIAQLSLGDGAVQNSSFYASIHQQSIDNQYGIAETEESKEQVHKGEKEQKFEGTEWDLFRAGVVDIDEQTVQTETTHQPKELCAKIDNVASRLKEMINSGDQQLSSGVTKFIAKFDTFNSKDAT